MKKRGVTDGTSVTPMAADLSRTKLSEHLESHVRVKVKEKFETVAKEKAAAENIALEEARKDIGMVGLITISTSNING